MFIILYYIILYLYHGLLGKDGKLFYLIYLTHAYKKQTYLEKLLGIFQICKTDWYDLQFGFYKPFCEIIAKPISEKFVSWLQVTDRRVVSSVFTPVNPFSLQQWQIMEPHDSSLKLATDTSHRHIATQTC